MCYSSPILPVMIGTVLLSRARSPRSTTKRIPSRMASHGMATMAIMAIMPDNVRHQGLCRSTGAASCLVQQENAAAFVQAKDALACVPVETNPTPIHAIYRKKTHSSWARNIPATSPDSHHPSATFSYKISIWTALPEAHVSRSKRMVAANEVFGRVPCQGSRNQHFNAVSTVGPLWAKSDQK